jgi:hypothetical protein
MFRDYDFRDYISDNTDDRIHFSKWEHLLHRIKYEFVGVHWCVNSANSLENRLYV